MFKLDEGMVCTSNAIGREPAESNTGRQREAELTPCDAENGCLGSEMLPKDDSSGLAHQDGPKTEDGTEAFPDDNPGHVKPAGSLQDANFGMEVSDMHIMGARDLLCYEAQCVGQGCLNELIISLADPTSHTCIAKSPNICYISYQKNSDPTKNVEKAGCGIDCKAFIPTTTKQTLADYQKESTTILREPLRSTKTTTQFFLDPRRRRKRSTWATERQCCYENYCNHGSHCGQLHCSAGLPMATKTLLLTFLGYVYVFQP